MPRLVALGVAGPLPGRVCCPFDTWMTPYCSCCVARSLSQPGASTCSARYLLNRIKTLRCSISHTNKKHWDATLQEPKSKVIGPVSTTLRRQHSRILSSV